MTDSKRPTGRRSRHRRSGVGSPTLGLRIRKIRSQRGLSQEVLAQRVGRSPNWMIDVENGKADPLHSDLVNIAEVLGVDVVQLVEGENDATVRRALPEAAVGAELDVFTSHIDSQLLDGMASLTRSYLFLHNTVSPTVLRPAVTRHFGDLVAIALKPHAPSMSSRIRTVAAQTAILAGWVSFNLQDLTYAYMYWSVAYDLAREAGNVSVQAHAHGARSRIHSPVHRDAKDANPTAALALVDHAIDLANHGASPTLRSWLFANRAQQLAATDQAVLSYRDLEASAHYVSLSERTRDDMLAGWNDVRVDAYRGICAMLLGRSSEVITITESVLARTDSCRVQRCLQQSDLAAAYAQCGDSERAASLLGDATEVATRTQFPEGANRARWTRAKYLSA